jgi:hypothetical protein
MSSFCGQIVTISQKGYTQDVGFYRIKEDRGSYMWTDEMIEGLVEEETKNWADISIPEGPYTVTYDSPSINDSMNKNNIHNEIILPKGYIFKDEDGNVINATKIVLEKKKKEYPKTYEECINELDTHKVVAACAWEKEMKALQTILICRDAYWKIAGEEMELGKPWEPDGNPVYAITRNDGCIVCIETGGNDEVFEFPTKEMRDTFYENFKEEIEICKELL